MIEHYIITMAGVAGGAGGLFVGALVDRYLERRTRERYRRENEAYDRKLREKAEEERRTRERYRREKAEEERLMRQARELKERPREYERKTSPFSFGQAVLEPICNPMYDTVTLDAAAPNGTRRCFVDQVGKYENDCSPWWCSGGSLPAPRMYVIDAIEFLLEPEEEKDYFEQEARRERDRRKIINNTWVRLKVGIKDYWTGKLSMLPYVIAKRRIALVSQQIFFLEFNTVGLGGSDLYGNWRLTGILKGELGMEVM